MASRRHINYKGILGIILVIVTPLRIFKSPNTANHIELDIVLVLWWVFVCWLLWSGWDPI